MTPESKGEELGQLKQNESLGATLRKLRAINQMTLRQIEEATGISNAYLSQLENDKIKKPSTNVLYKLAKIYGVDVDVLLIASGIIIGEAKPMLKIGVNLTSEEEKQLLEYLNFLRWRKKR